METATKKIAFKIKIKDACLSLLKERIANALQAMTHAQEAANNQEKSSVGDKHETSRAISQAERDMNARQLQQAEKDLHFLEAISVEQLFESVVNGCVFKIGEQLFFVAIGLGALTIDDKTLMVISHQSPLFLEFKMKKRGDKGSFRAKQQQIEEVF
ncbi:MAG: 3-oxoacyl-ACP synthase [Bacteroidota bacterium]